MFAEDVNEDMNMAIHKVLRLHRNTWHKSSNCEKSKITDDKMLL